MSKAALDVRQFEGPLAVEASRAIASSQEEAIAEQGGQPVGVGHAVTRDFAIFSKTKPNKFDYLERAHAKSGRGTMEVRVEESGRGWLEAEAG